VRRFFIDNALAWIMDYHLDALRLDALHAVFDFSPQPFLAELAEAVHKVGERLGRRVYLMGESDLNDIRLLRPPGLGGYGLDAQWNDDFHHALHVLLTGEQSGYYQDYQGVGQLAKAWREGFIYSGQYSPYRRRRHGSSSAGLAPERFVVFSQNHDQVGNRLKGDRLSQLVSFEALKLAAGVILLSPFVPLIFMGEEYGETAPFCYFISHGDPALVEAVRRGRQEEFAGFRWQGEPWDPQAEETFHRSRLNQTLRQKGHHKVLQDFYRELLQLRRELAQLTDLGRRQREVREFESLKVLWVRSQGEGAQTVMFFHFGGSPAELCLPVPPGQWHKRLDSTASCWGGPGVMTPERLEGGQEVRFILPPNSLMVYIQK